MNPVSISPADLSELELPGQAPVDHYQRGRLFPLYLCPFESFLRADSRADYPMAFGIMMRFLGQLDEPAFGRALDQALERHRVLKCVVGKGKKNRLSWIYNNQLRAPVVRLEADQSIQCDHQFDDSREAGVRVWFRQSKEKVEVIFYFNHVTVDGVGAHQFLGDLWACYANEVSGPGTAELVDLDPLLLKNRGHRQRYANLENKQKRSSTEALKYGLKTLLLPRSQPLAIPKPARDQIDDAIPFLHVFTDTLTKEEHKRLRDVAIEHGATVNDILSAESFIMFQQWNSLHNQLQPRRPFRIVLPTNLRGRGDENMPAVNMTSYTFLERLPNQCTDRIALVRSIREETARIKNEALGTELIEALSRAASTRWAIPLATRLRAGSGTIVLTNVGDPTRRYTCQLPRKAGAIIAGNLELDDCYGFPPLRKHTRATIAITTYQRRLTVSLRCDPALFRYSQAESMLKMYMDGLRSWFNNEKKGSGAFLQRKRGQEPFCREKGVRSLFGKIGRHSTPDYQKGS
jgi:NRPS condensation-like uncharacterized protein